MVNTCAHRDLVLKLYGLMSLVATTALWGSSFVFIKLSVMEVSPYTYTFARTAIASAILIPLVLLKARVRGVSVLGLKRGFITGIVYSLGLCLQAAGTAYIDPSLSAFITGLSTIHVHLYSALVLREYTKLDLVALSSAVGGLYVLTSPTGGFDIGEALVFAATFMWAAQIVLIARYRNSPMLEFLAGNFLAGLVFAPLALHSGIEITTEALLYLAYLALVCSVGATFFQVLGQRYVSPSTASLLFLLEPVFATVFSILCGLEEPQLHKVVGGGLILLSLFIVSVSEAKR